MLNSQAPLMMIQETKASAHDLLKFRTIAQLHGLAFSAQPASGQANARSGGVMVAWRRHLAVDTKPAFVASNRSVSATLRTRHLGDVVVCSLYLHQGQPLHEAGLNDALLHSVLDPLRDGGASVLLGADWNHPLRPSPDGSTSTTSLT